MARSRPQLLLMTGVLLIATDALNMNCHALAQDQKVIVADAPPKETAASVDTVDRHDWVIDHPNVLGLSLVKNVLYDQKTIWTSPVRLRWEDSEWLLPLTAVTAALFATDRSAIKSLPTNPTTQHRFTTASNYGAYTLVGAAGGLYLLGAISHDDHASETGLLAGEAAVDSLAVTSVFKYSLGRDRPYQDQAGPFFRGGDSFPSDHAAVAWSVASVIAHEYPAPLTQLLVYGLATAVSASRVVGQQHFPSDVFVGSAIGWLVGQEVYRTHHDPDLGGSSWLSLSQLRRAALGRESGSKGSPYVPLDSWIYPALDRLIAMNYVHTDYQGLRPWTRAECAQMLKEVGDNFGPLDGAPAGVGSLYKALMDEFAPDLSLISGDRTSAAQLESVYTRVMDISGPPLNDSYHFGQTIVDDFGRPYAEGFNSVSGFSGWASTGRVAFYVRGEYQHAPSAPAYSQAVQDFIAQVDFTPVQPARATPTVNQFTLLDTYAAMKVSNWELSFGKQSLWWGPAQGGALLMSDNAEPFVMFRARTTEAYKLPWILGLVGPIKAELFVGQLEDNQFPARPMLHGTKLTSKPTESLELGLSATTEFGGVGRPITAASILNSYFSTSSSDFFPPNQSPGKRTIGWNFTYKIPYLRNWLTLYDDGLLPEDNPTNLDVSGSSWYTPERSAMRPGIYLSHVPGVPKLDLRIEAVYTAAPTPRSCCGDYVYFNNFYHQLYTENGYIIGDWIGREGMGFQGWSTYWFSPRNSVQFEYRHVKVATDFIPRGETINDGSVKVNWQLRPDLSLTAYLQYEKWLALILAPGPQTNWTSAIQVQFSPRSRSW